VTNTNGFVKFIPVQRSRYQNSAFSLLA